MTFFDSTEILRRAAYGAGLTAVLAVLSGSSALAQSRCDEPTEADYSARMAETRAAIEADDFAAAVHHLTEAGQHYDYPLIEYSLARAYHRLGDLEAAEASYTRFLQAFTGCPDPHQLVASAREYRNLAVAERARLLSEQARAEAAPLAVEPPPESDGIHPAWAAVGAGAALILTGVVFDVTQADLDDDRAAAAARGDLVAYREAQDAIATGRVVDGLLYGTGLAAAAVGVILLLADGEPAAQSRTAASAPAPFLGVRF